MTRFTALGAPGIDRLSGRESRGIGAGNGAGSPASMGTTGREKEVAESPTESPVVMRRGEGHSIGNCAFETANRIR